MKPEIFLNFDLPPLEAALQRSFKVHRRSALSNMTEFLITSGRQIQVIVSVGSIPIDVAELDLMPSVKAIVLFSAGYENIDLDMCKARGIAVTSCSGANAGDVADMAFGLLLAVARNIPHGDRFVRSGSWTATNRGSGLREGVFGSTLGILGLGAIGLEIAKRASGFEMPVIYHNRKPREDVPYTYVEDVMALAKLATHLVIACPLTEDTRKVIDKSVLRTLGPSGILINIARGGVVDEQALIDCLTAGEILGAGLDVYANEPDVPQALRDLENVVMTPHTAGFTRRVFRNMGEMVEENTRCALSGQDLINRIV